MKNRIVLLSLMFSALTLGSCIDINIGGFKIKGDDVESAVNVGKAVLTASDDFTPEQEHYIGRTVAASLLSQYEPYGNQPLNSYLNTLGQVLAACSDRPETFGGYHFLAINSSEMNAFAAPGGFVLVTTALIKSCQNEDQLAAVLAHEVAHVQHMHGIKAIKKSRWANVGAVLAREAAGRYTDKELADLVSSFDGVIDDVVQTVVNSGYSRGAEFEADLAATVIMKRAGYNAKALAQMLQVLESNHVEGGNGFAKTHPHPKDRLKEVNEELEGSPAYVASLARNGRFRNVMSRSGLK